MKGLIPAIGILTLVSLACAFLAGCAYTSVERGEVRVRRLSLLYPAEAGSVRVSTTNEVWEITGYKSDGGAAAAAAVTAAAVGAAVKAAK